MPAENPQYTQFNHQQFVKRTADAILEKNVTLNELKSRNRIFYNQGGTKIEQRVRFDRNTIRRWGPMAQNDTIVPQLFTTATYSWGGSYADYFIDKWDIMMNKGPEAILDQMDELSEAVKKDFMEDFENYMYTNGLTETPAGIGGFAAFIKTTGTYAGISQTNTYWKAQSIALSGSTTFAANPLKYLTQLENLCTRGSNNTRPHAGFTTRAVWNTVHDKIETIRRVVYDDEKVKVGHRNFLNNGVPYFWSDSAVTSTVYLVNFDTLRFVCQSKKLIEEDDFELPKPRGTLYQCFHKGQLCCDNPRMNGVITGAVAA